MFLNEKEYEDHLICHKLEGESEISNNNLPFSRDILPFEIQKSILPFHDNDGINIPNCQNEEFAHKKDELVLDFDLIEDKEEILKELEEDEIFRRKFQDKKITSENSNEGIVKKQFLIYSNLNIADFLRL